MNRQILSPIIIVLACCSILTAQWSDDPAVNLQVSTWGDGQQITSDGDGGVFIVFGSHCGSENYEYCQYIVRLDKWGYLKWDPPIQVLGMEDAQTHPQIVPDNEGGVFICFIDMDFIEYIPPMNIYDYKLRVQRIDSIGTHLWGNGILVSLDTLQHLDFNMIQDGSGGCYISWTGQRELYNESAGGRKSIQRISAAGERLWSDTGLVIREEDYYHANVRFSYPIISNGLGGVIVEYRGNDSIFYYKNLDSSGATVWDVQRRIKGTMVTDNNGGLIVVGINLIESGNYYSLLMDRILLSGNYAWNNVKTVVDTVRDNSEVIELHFNNDSITSLYWRDLVGSSDYNSYYQRIFYDGVPQFEGKGITPFDINSYGSAMIRSFDNFILLTGNFAQKISINGQILWDSTGLQFSERSATEANYISDMQGGFIKVWVESIYGIWAQQVSVNGNLGEVLLSLGEYTGLVLPDRFTLYQNYPNPFNPVTTIMFDIPEFSAVQLTIYDLPGREIKELLNTHLYGGIHSITWDGKDQYGRALSSGMYFYRIDAVSEETGKQFHETRKMVLLQ